MVIEMDHGHCGAASVLCEVEIPTDSRHVEGGRLLDYGATDSLINPKVLSQKDAI